MMPRANLKKRSATFRQTTLRVNSMNSQNEFKIAIGPDGQLTAIYSDSLADLCEAGSAVVVRVSHVEPDPNGPGWIADLGPINGPMLGPYRLREDALKAEMRFLDKALF